MNYSDVITLDFETQKIDDEYNTVPAPVGLAVKWGDHPASYWHWGHPDTQNCDEAFARELLLDVWDTDRPLLFHNAKFDIAVAMQWAGVGYPDWRRVHDTAFLAYLLDPHARTHALKPLAHRLLGMAPDEQDEVGAWIWANRKELKTRYGGKVLKSQLGAWIAKAPGDLVGKYAIGDVERTRALFDHMHPQTGALGMLPAYDTERELLPILMENEAIGLRVDVDRLNADIEAYQAAMRQVEADMRAYLNVTSLNFDADRELADALAENNLVAPDAWVLTKTGQRSVSKENLTLDMFTDPEFASALGYRNRLKTALTMFMIPWAAQAEKRGGRISTRWHQTRGGDGGARTGRPSTSNPNFLNISKDFEDKGDGYTHPEFLDLPRLPLVRRYLLPDEGHVLLGRDFASQELRVFAHFEDGALKAAYLADPKLDAHAYVGGEITRITGKTLKRGAIKILNFQALYGGGVPAAAAKLKCSLAEAKEFKAMHDAALPGRKGLADDIKRAVGRGEAIATLGGRLYRPEAPSYSEKFQRVMTWEYKLVNYLIQGSAADLTKRAIIDWFNDPRRHADCRFYVTVYDEIVVTCPSDVAEEQMAVLREAMNADRLSVPMLSDGEIGLNWADMQECA